MKAPSRFGAGTKAVVAVLAVNLGLLLGCAELDKLIGGPNANKATATNTKAKATPTPAATPGTLATTFNTLGKDVGKAGTAVKDAKDKVVGPIEKAIDDITPQDERALGQAVSFHVVAQNDGLLRDERLTTYVNEVGNLVAQSGRRREIREGTGKRRTEARRFFFGVLASDDLNAYAAPGGYIFVTRGLVQNLSSEAELAWVLGHEIAHVDEEDGLTGLKAQAAVQGSGFFGRPVEGATGFENPDFFGKMVGKLAEIISQGSFLGSDELKADQIGLTYAIDAGYDARGAERALTLLGTKQRKQRILPSGHKSPVVRLDLLKERIADAKPGKVGELRYDTEAVQRVEASLIAADATPGTPSE